MNESIASLKDDYKHCQSVIKKYSKSFYYAFSNLPEKDAQAVYAVYAYCRLADDAVDEAEDRAAALENLNKLRRQLDEFCNGVVPDEPMWRALNDVRNRYELDISMLYTQLEGQETDLHFSQPPNMKELREYSKKVAGSVGRLLLPILSDDCSKHMQEKAEQLGIAMQITNILRDVGEDIEMHQRVYIPESVLDQYDHSVEALENSTVNQDFIDAWEYLAGEAEMIYDDFRAEIINYKREARLPLLVSLSVYREILNEVRKNGYNCLKKRNAVPMARKLEIKSEEKYFLKTLES